MLAAKSMNSDFHPSALANIYEEAISMAVWNRTLEDGVSTYAQVLLNATPCFETRFIETPEGIAKQLEKQLVLGPHRQAFIQDVVLVSEMFSCLFELKQVGLRMAVLNRAMCPKFHVDRVPCRLICTYAGVATQWHPHEQVERFSSGELAPIQNAMPRNLTTGDVALLKGEAWLGNEGRGLVHRSPEASDTARRLVLTLDFA